jgi:uncharacterized protein
VTALPPGERHLPQRVPIEGYGEGGFRFGGMSHRGSLLVVPAGVFAWAPKAPDELDERSLARVILAATEIDLLIVGMGRNPRPLPKLLRTQLAEAGIRFDAMATGSACSTYNLLLEEGRRVSAALIAVD